MSKSNTTETDYLTYELQGTAPSWDAVANLYVALHTADPGEAGVQTTNEATYGGYGRVAVARSAAGWSITDQVGSNVATVSFPECTGGSETATYVSVGTAETGAGQILRSGAISPIAITAGVTPEFLAGMIQVTED